MAHKLQQRKQSGFTIIEVMIVLAIAAMILLVVLLAIPALQRSSRNTAIKNDATSVAAAVSEYESNNSGTLPAAVSGTSPNIKLCDASTCGASVSPAAAKVQGSTTVTVVTGAQSAATLSAGTVVVNAKVSCDTVTFDNSTGKYTSTAAPSTRSSAVLYSIETKGGTSGGCIDS